VIVEGPGHVPFDQIQKNMEMQKEICDGAPFYVLGPVVTDIFPGYDHITSAIGATAAAFHGACYLCYVTPKEHLGLPNKDDVKQGVIAYKIAAHAADIALKLPAARERDDEIARARAALNWERHFELAYDSATARALHDEDLAENSDYCAMCGREWCAERISKELPGFAAGKDAGSQPTETDKPRRVLNAEELEILAKRGTLPACHKAAEKGPSSS
jgi:phosphomethylpyrimidine synthase